MTLAGALYGQQQDGVAVRQTFQSYWSAIQDRDGTQARALVTTATLDSYERLRDEALYGTRSELEKHPIFERLIVLTFRLRFTLTELQMTPGAELFGRGVDQGWTASGSAGESTLQDVVIVGNRAEARMASGPGDAGAPIHFAREDGQWKVDLLSLSAAVEQSLQAYLQSDEVTEQRLIEETLAASYGDALPDNIWEPLIH